MMKTKYDTLPLAFNQTLRKYLKDKTRSKPLENAAVETLNEGAYEILYVLNQIFVGEKPEAVFKNLADWARELKRNNHANASNISRFITRMQGKHVKINHEQWISMVSKLRVQEHLREIQVEMQKFFQKGVNIENLIIMPPYPVNLKGKLIDKFYNNTVTPYDAVKLSPPYYSHDKKTIVMVLPEKIPTSQKFMKTLRFVIAHEACHSMLPYEFTALMFADTTSSRLEKFAGSIGDLSQIKLFPVTSGDEKMELFMGIPPRKIELFTNILAAKLLYNIGDKESIPKELKPKLENLDWQRITRDIYSTTRSLAKVRLISKQMMLIDYLRDKSLRGILKKRFEIKKEVKGMSTTELKKFVWKKRWNKLRMNIAEFERNLNRFVKNFEDGNNYMAKNL